MPKRKKNMKNKSQNSRKKKVDCTQVRYIRKIQKRLLRKAWHPDLKLPVPTIHCTSTRENDLLATKKR